VKFLSEKQLTAAIKRVIKDGEVVKLAVAYWGADALDLLGLNPRRKGVNIVCCLQGGKSDPDVIKKFGKRARHNNKLHAKVIWTPTAAIVGSANASSNGLPEEEALTKGLIEAGIYVDDDRDLRAIETWFASKFRNAKRVTAGDLRQAREARDERNWGGSNRTHTHSLIDAMKTGKKEFLKQRISFIITNQYMSKKRQREATIWAKRNETDIGRKFSMPNIRWEELSYYDGWDRLPLDSYLIDIFRSKGHTEIDGPFRTFQKRIFWDGIEYVLRGPQVRFPYKITKKDRRVIRSAAKELWKASGESGILSLNDAALTLLKHSAR
jgi:hypothetical protein